jgi:hypothetical protein
VRSHARLVVAALVLGPAAPAGAHWLMPEQVLAELRSPAVRDAFGVVEAAPKADLPRLLVIRVDARWAKRPAAERRAAAERWDRRWHESVPQGIVAIVDETSGRSLVSYDAHRAARLIDAPPAAAAGD